MKKVIFFTVAALFCAHAEGMENGNVAKKIAIYEEKSNSATPKSQSRKGSDSNPFAYEEHLQATFPQGHPSKDLSDESLRELLLTLYPIIFQGKRS